MGTRITALPSATVPTLADVLPLVQSGTTKKATLQALLGAGELVISPSSIGTQQNDYSPTGFGSARIVRLSLSASCAISGFSVTGVTVLHKTLIIASGDFILQLLQNDPASAAGNRILTPYPNDIYMALNEARDIWLDVASSAWRFV